MKVYSDTLTRDDMLDALPKGVSLDECEPIQNPRVRTHGWNVRLRRWGSSRHVNSGNYGAGEQGAASWDDHGWWMAELFERDPSARIANWDGRESFNVGTEYRYASLISASLVTAGGTGRGEA
jgi:hypothetical protein